MRPTLGEIKHW